MPTVAATLAARAALEDFFSANPKVAGVLAACADAGLDADATRRMIADRGLTKQANRAFRLAKAAAGPFDFGSHSTQVAPGLPGRSTPFRAPDAPSTYDAAKAPKLPSGPALPEARPPVDPSPSWGALGADYAKRLYTGAKGGLTAVLGTGLRGVTAVGQGAVGAANWAAGTPYEQSPWANYLAGAQESLGQFAGAGAQNVANAFNGAAPTAEPGFDALAQQHAQHKQWADQAVPDGWNNLPGQASHVGGLAATAALAGKPVASLTSANAINQGAMGLAGRGAAGVGGFLKTLPGQMTTGAVSSVGGVAGMNAYNKVTGQDQFGPQAPVFPSSVDIDVSKMTPQHADEYINNGMRGFGDTIQKLKLEDPDQIGWREKAVPELAGPLRAMAVGVAARTGRNPRELFDQVMANGPQAIDFDHLQSLASVPGNEAFLQPPPDKPTGQPETMGAPPPNAPGAQPQGGAGGLLGGSNPLQGIWSFLNNDQISPWARTGVAVGIPLAVIGALSGMLGEGGLGSLIMTIFGVGSALAGAHAGGLADVGKAFGTLTGGWGAQGKPGTQPAGDPGKPAPPPFPEKLTPEHLNTWGAMAPQDRVQQLLPKGIDEAEQVRRLSALSKAYDVNQLSGLLAGAGPKLLAEKAKAIQDAPIRGEGFLGRIPFAPAFDRDVQAELLQAIQQRLAAGGQP